MAIVECSECGKAISTTVFVCHWCGAPTSEQFDATQPFSTKMPVWVWAFLGLASVIAISLVVGGVREVSRGVRQPSPSQSVRQPSPSQSVRQPSPSQSVRQPSSATSYTEIGLRRDVSFGSVSRFEYAIAIPPGRSRADVDATLRRAAETIGRRERADALQVIGYKQGEPTTGVYTAGRAIWAPGGDWANASSSEAKKVTVHLGDLYFRDLSSTRSAGDSATVVSSTGYPTAVLSDSYDNWGLGHIVAELAVGTRVQVVSSKSEVVTPSYKMTRLRVRVVVNGRSESGWMHDFDLK